MVERSADMHRVMAALRLCPEPLSLESLGRLTALGPGDLKKAVDLGLENNWLASSDGDPVGLGGNIPKKVLRKIELLVSPELAAEMIDRLTGQGEYPQVPAKFISNLYKAAGREKEASPMLYDRATKEIQRRNLKGALEYCREGVFLLRGRLEGHDESRLFLNATFMLSDLCYLLRQGHAEVRQLLLEAEEAALELGDQRLRAMLHLHAGRIAVFLRMLDQSVQDSQKGFDLVAEMGDRDMIARSSPFYASFFYTQGLIREAAAYAEKAVSVPLFHIERIPDYMRPTILAMSWAFMGHFSRAIGVLDSHWRRILSDGAERPGIFLRATLGQVLLMCRKMDEAMVHLREAVKVSQASGDSLSLFWAGRALSYHHFLEGRLHESYETLAQCMGEVRQAGFPRPYYAMPWFLEMLSLFHQMGYAPIPGCEYPKEMQAALDGINVLLRGVALRIRAGECRSRGAGHKEIESLLLRSESELERSGATIELAKTRAELALLELGLNAKAKARVLALKSWEGWIGLEADEFPAELRVLIGGREASGIPTHPGKDLLRRYIEMVGGLIPVGEPDEVWTQLLNAACQFFEAERGGIFSLEKGSKGKRVRLRKGYNLSAAQALENNFQTHLAVVKKALKVREPVVTRLPVVAQGSSREVIFHVVCLPLEIGGPAPVVIYCDMRFLPGSLEFFDNFILLEIAQSLGNFTSRTLEYAKSTEERSRMTLGEITTVKKWASDFSRDFGSTFSQLTAKADQVAASDASVLILGETGVGKEVLARRIHDQSHRATGPFMAIDLSSIPEPLVESEIFGHEKGAFTGADRQKPGRMELAHTGTLFIDEVGEIPKAVQVKLLRAIEDRSFIRVGGIVIRTSDFRLIAATNRNLVKEVENGNFREDLYYRLCVVPFIVPPLRERGGDVVLLAEHFLDHYCRKYHLPLPRLSSGHKAMLKAYPWPGNIRELKNVIERSVILSGQGPFDLNMSHQPTKSSGAERLVHRISTDKPSMEELQRRYIQLVLEDTGGKISGPGGAAEILGMKRSTLQHRMRKLGLSG